MIVPIINILLTSLNDNTHEGPINVEEFRKYEFTGTTTHSSSSLSDLSEVLTIFSFWYWKRKIIVSICNWEIRTLLSRFTILIKSFLISGVILLRQDWCCQ